MKGRALRTALAAVVVALCVAQGRAGGQELRLPPRPTAAGGEQIRLIGTVVHTGPGAGVAEQLARSLDAGDSYMTPGGERKLRRLAGAVAVRIEEDADRPAVLASLDRAGRAPCRLPGRH